MALKQILKKIKLAESTISSFLGVLVVLVVGLLIFKYFQGIGKTALAPENKPETAEFSETTEVIPEGLPTMHKVKLGEDLWQIAVKYYNSGYNWVDIAQENKLSNPNILFSETELKIPSVKRRIPLSEKQKGVEPITEEKYTVVKGDSLWKIALRAYGDGYRWVEIAKANKLANPSLIHSGNILVIPR